MSVVASVVILLALLTGTCPAQSPTGTISGSVRDSSGAVIPLVDITITNLETSHKRSVTTSAEGVYSTAALPAGRYETRAEAAGFAVLVRQAEVSAGMTTTVDFSMSVGAKTEVLNIEGASARISYDRHSIDGAVTRVQIESLPLNGRSFLELAKLEPGVSVSTVTSNQANRQFEVSVLAAPALRTRITVDGGDVLNWVNGGSSTNFSQEIIREFQISSANFDLATGIAAAGAINVVTRSGSNDYHGSGFYFFRDHHLAAYPGLTRDPFNQKPFFARRQTGFHFGGPIRKNRLFFFTNLEHNNQDGVVTVQPRTADFVHFGLIAPSPVNGRLASARFDLHLTPRHTASLRYSHDGNNSFSPLGPVFTLPSTWLKETNWSDQSLGSLTSVLGSNATNDLRFSYVYWRVRDTPPAAADCGSNCFGLGVPSTTVLGTRFGMGNGAFLPQGADLRTFNLLEGVSWQKGLHRLRFGFEWEYHLWAGALVFSQPANLTLYAPETVRLFNANVTPEFRIPLPGSFQTVEDILRLPLVGFSTGIGDPSFPPPYNFDRARRDHMWRFYWQDAWRIRPGFTLNYGVSYHYKNGPVNTDLPKPEYLRPILGAGGLTSGRPDRNNVAPAVGFAWSITRDNKTVVRGGAGIYYDLDLTPVWRAQERISLGPRGNGLFSVDGSQVPNPIPGIPGVPVGRPLNFSAGPTSFTGSHLLSILPAVRNALQRELGNPRNGDLSIRNIEIFKQGSQVSAPDFVTSYSEHFSIGAQRELTPDLALNADFVFRQFIRTDMGAIDYNRWDSIRGPVLPICLAAQRLDPKALCSTGPITVRTSGGRSHYKGLLLRLDKRFSRRTQFLASYALSSAVGFNGVVNKEKWFESFGPLSTDRRHIVNVSGIVDLPGRFRASFISTISTGTPFTATISAVDFNGDGTNGDVLPGSLVNRFNRSLGKDDLSRLTEEFNRTLSGTRTVRGQLIPRITLPASYDFGDSRFSQDIRISRSFRIQEHGRLTLLAEVFNVLNIANLAGYSGNLREPSAFGQPTSRVQQVFGSGGPRAFQFGARFSFLERSLSIPTDRAFRRVAAVLCSPR